MSARSGVLAAVVMVGLGMASQGCASADPIEARVDGQTRPGDPDLVWCAHCSTYSDGGYWRGASYPPDVPGVDRLCPGGLDPEESELIAVYARAARLATARHAGRMRRAFERMPTCMRLNAQRERATELQERSRLDPEASAAARRELTEAWADVQAHYRRALSADADAGNLEVALVRALDLIQLSVHQAQERRCDEWERDPGAPPAPDRPNAGPAILGLEQGMNDGFASVLGSDSALAGVLGEIEAALADPGAAAADRRAAADIATRLGTLRRRAQLARITGRPAPAGLDDGRQVDARLDARIAGAGKAR